MSPRRKSGLSQDDIEALKHLNAVLTAVQKVTALGMSLRAATEGAFGPRVMRPDVPPGQENDLVVTGPGRVEPDSRDGAMDRARAHYDATTARQATLDTPERREYEEAKRAGRKVPAADPFANASPAQRERMAEQRAIIDAARAARGLPTRTVMAPRPATLEEVLAAAPDEEVAVRTETLDTVSDGTTPLADDADDDPEVH